MTTRRYPRSLVEAWPHHYPHSITRHKRPLADRVASFIKASAMAGVFVTMVLYGLEALV